MQTKMKIKTGIDLLMTALLLLLMAYQITGLYLFGRKDILSYMFLEQQFVFFDLEQSAEAVFVEYIAMMGFWVFAVCYISKGTASIPTSKNSVQKTW